MFPAIAKRRRDASEHGDDKAALIPCCVVCMLVWAQSALQNALRRISCLAGLTHSFVYCPSTILDRWGVCVSRNKMWREVLKEGEKIKKTNKLRKRSGETAVVPG